MSLFTGNKDIDRYILLNLTDREMINVCSVNKYARKEICDDKFFLLRIIKKFPSSLKYKKVNMRWKEYYVNIVKIREKLQKEYGFSFISGDPYLYEEILDMTSIEASLEKAAAHGLLDLLKFLETQTSLTDFTYVLQEAIQNDQQEIINYLMDKPIRDYDTLLYTATKYKNFPLMERLIQLGADINEALFAAAEINDEKLVERFLNFPEAQIINYIKGTIQGGYLYILKDIIKKYPEEWQRIFKIDNPLDLALYSGNIELIDFISSFRSKYPEMAIHSFIHTILRQKYSDEIKIKLLDKIFKLQNYKYINVFKKTKNPILRKYFNEL